MSGHLNLEETQKKGFLCVNCGMGGFHFRDGRMETENYLLSRIHLAERSLVPQFKTYSIKNVLNLKRTQGTQFKTINIYFLYFCYTGNYFCFVVVFVLILFFYQCFYHLFTFTRLFH